MGLVLFRALVLFGALLHRRLLFFFLSIGGVSFRVPVRLFYHFGLFDDYFNFDCYECGGVLVGFQ